jgi:hypothetical protein
MSHTADATETGLIHDNCPIKSELKSEIVVKYKNYSGSYDLTIGANKTGESITGLVTEVVVHGSKGSDKDGGDSYKFPVRQTVQPGTTVVLKLDDKNLYATFPDILGGEEKVSLIKQKGSEGDK